MEKFKMLKSLLKTFAGITAALLLTVNAFADCCGCTDDCCPCDCPCDTCPSDCGCDFCPPECDPEGYNQGHAICPNQMMAAYNAPANIDVRCPWDVFVTGSFIYWHTSEEGLEYAISSTTTALPITDGKVIDFDYDYKPGFKVGLGINLGCDGWDGYVEYTWLHFNETSSATRPGTTGVLLPTWLHPANNITAISASARWKFRLDVINLELARSYYVGTHLTFRTHFGLRVPLIDQNYNLGYIAEDAQDVIIQSRNSSDSWGIGPRAGINTNWLLGCGFRIFGNAAADIAYTRYKITRQETDANDPSTLAVDLTNRDRLKTLRSHAEMELGLAWGTYFDCNNWHFDLAASYDFHYFWDQNVFRRFVSSQAVGKSFTDRGDLFLHGLTIQARLDF
jgi:Legionella pneumophila major outer membrane protein precursor